VEAALAGRVRGVLDVALHRFLGITLVDPDDPARGITLVVGDEAVNNTDVLHGGIVTALLDVACYLTLLPQLTLRPDFRRSQAHGGADLVLDLLKGTAGREGPCYYAGLAERRVSQGRAV